MNKHLGENLEIKEKTTTTCVGEDKGYCRSSTPELTSCFLNRNSDIEEREMMEGEHVNCNVCTQARHSSC